MAASRQPPQIRNYTAKIITGESARRAEKGETQVGSMAKAKELEPLVRMAGKYLAEDGNISALMMG